MKFGICTTPTHLTVQPVELARWAEDSGFESLWVGEHSHIPVNRKTPFPLGYEMPDHYKMFFDPFVALTAAAVATTKLKLGTSVCLIPEHDPIILAKASACLDIVSGGRFLLGFGGGWNEEEMENHGVELKNRWAVTRERVMAMREIWKHDAAEFHGKFVNFDPIWCWPKPATPGGPRVMMGAASKWSPRRIAEYCTGWLAPDIGEGLAAVLEDVRSEMEKAGRSMDELDFTVVTEYQRYGDEHTAKRVVELEKLGFTRVVLVVDPDPEKDQRPWLARSADFIARMQ